MSKSQPVTQSSTQQTSIDPWLSQAAQGVAGQVGQLPGYQAYTGAGPAGLTPQQLQALGLSSQNAGQGQGIAMGAYNPLSALTGFNAPQVNAGSLNDQVAGLMSASSPYTQNLINATNTQIDRNTAGAMNNADTSLAAQHAFGGSRQGVADAVVQNQGALQKNQTAAQLNQQGYNNALQTALSGQQGNQNAALQGGNLQLGAANALSGLGSNISGLNTQDLNNLLNAGGVAQNSQTAQNMFGYQNWMNNMTMPGQMLGQQASILGSLPHGQTQTGQQSQMSYTNPLMQLGGLGLGIGGMGLPGQNGQSGGTVGGSALKGLAGMFSDRRLKEDIEPIGSLFDDTPLYRFRYKGDPISRVGVMADEVDPSDTVMHPSGYKMVDYARVAQRAAQAR